MNTNNYLNIDNRLQYSCVAGAVRSGAKVDPKKKRVTFTYTQLEAYTAKSTLNAIDTFTLLQRKAGVQTVQWETVGEDSGLSFLAERIIENWLVRPEDRTETLRILTEKIVDIRPLVDERLRALCNGDRQASEYRSDVVSQPT